MITDKILRKIKAKRRGWVFCAKDFHDLGSRNAIDKALSRMADDNNSDNDNKIVRVTRGVYYFPVVQQDIGIIPANMNAVADAIARNVGVVIYPSGASSANTLGLSNQVPAKNIYWTHGKSMTKHFGKNTIQFKHIRINPMPHTPASVMIVLNALSYLGKTNINDIVIKKCAKVLNDTDRKSLQKMSSRVSGWLSIFIPKIIAA
jgi:hypothetical protein